MTFQASPLLILQGIDVTESMLTSTTVPENDYPVWTSGTTYPIGSITTGEGCVIWKHYVWVSAVASNVGNEPELLSTKWQRVRPVNRWRLFDRSNSTATAQAGSISYTLALPEGVDALWMGGLVNHTQLTVTQTHPQLGVVCDQTRVFQSLQLESDWYAWTYTKPRPPPTAALVQGIKAIPGTTLTFTLTGGPALSVSTALLGALTRIGLPVHQGAGSRIRDFSGQKENPFGDLELQKGAYSKNISLAAWIPYEDVDAVYEFLADLRSTPALFVGNPDITSLQAYGIYEDWDIVFSMPTYRDYNIKIKSFT